MALPHLPLIEHKVKKGENLTKIVKSHGHPGKEWRTIYDGYYNKAFKAKFKNPNVILPGEVFKVPAVKRQKLEELIRLMWDIEDWTKKALSAEKSVWTELKKLKKERVKTRKAFHKSKGKLLDAYKWDSDVKKLADRCWKEDSATGGKLPLGAAAKCATDLLSLSMPKKKMDDLKSAYEASAIDHEKVNKKIGEIEKHLEARKKVIDAIVGAQNLVTDYLQKNYKFFYG